MKIRTGARAAAVLLALCLADCGSVRPPKPPITPTPTPPPVAAFEELRLTRSGTVFTDAAGKPINLKGTARCCFTDDSPADTACDPGWALVSRCAIKDTADKAGPDAMIHLRLGPYRVQPDWGAEQNSAGSPYLEVGGKADLAQWDPKFWAYLQDKRDYAGSLGVRLEVDLMDGWGIKWQVWRPDEFPQGHPWRAVSNVQSQEWVLPPNGAGTKAILPGTVWDAFIRKAVDTFSDKGNVVYQVGNENGQIPNHAAEWEITACNIVHDQEAKRGFKPHLCGSNVPEKVGNRAEIDFLTTHADPPFSQLRCNDVTRPCRQNEDNNNYTGDVWGQLYCDAKKNGLYRDLWRADMPRPAFDVALSYLKNGCASVGPVGCFDIPNEDAVQVLPKPAADPTVVTSVNGAIEAVHPECVGQATCEIHESQQVFLQKVAAEIRKSPSMCAGIQTVPEPVPGSPVDEICVGLKVPGTGRCDVCQGNHIFSCKSVTCPPGNPNCGCDSGFVKRAPKSYADASDTWKRPGAAAMSMAASSSAHPPAPDRAHGTDKVTRRDRRPVQP
jgi:hypothetical protein